MPLTGPYHDPAINLVYNLLFCDDIGLYKSNAQEPFSYPFDILYAGNSSVADLQKIIDDNNADPRVKMLAYNKQMAAGHKPAMKELLGVIVEVSLDEGLDVLASFQNGTARYINHTGKLLIWETTDQVSDQLTRDLFSQSYEIVKRIGPWDKPRLPSPAKGDLRITFLVSDGLYFGEGGINVLFNDPMAAPALATATQLMKYLTEKAVEAERKHS